MFELLFFARTLLIAVHFLAPSGPIISLTLHRTLFFSARDKLSNGPYFDRVLLCHKISRIICGSCGSLFISLYFKCKSEKNQKKNALPKRCSAHLDQPREISIDLGKPRNNQKMKNFAICRDMRSAHREETCFAICR